MDVVEAVSTAKRHILKVFEDEKISNLGLKEAFFDENQNVWHITLCFSRPWIIRKARYHKARLALAQTSAELERSYKTVEISEKDNKVLSVNNYTT